MPASAAFHFAAQASLLKYQISPSASVTATADSAVGIEAGAWQITSAYNSLTSDWVLSAATKTSVSVTAPAGSNKSAILQYTVNGGGPTDPRTGQPSNGDLIKTAKLYSGNETIVPGETIEGSAQYGWADRVNDALAVVGSDDGTLTSTDATFTLDGSTTSVVLDVPNDSTLEIRPQQAASGAGKKLRLGGADGQTPGTSAPGNTEINLGRTVGGTSAQCLFVTNTGGADTTRLSIEAISGGVRIWDVSDTLDIYGASLQLRGTNVSVAGRITDNSVTTPAQWTAQVDNFALTAGSGIYRVSTDASRDLTGLSGGAAGNRIRLFNIGSFAVVLKHESASSTAANRFALPGAADLTLNAGHCVVLWYDGTSSRWRAEAQT